MPWVDDQVDKVSEHFDSEIGSIDFVTVEVASKYFPDVKLSTSKNISYFPFKLCHSLPTRNARGRSFTPKVLHNSFSSLNDQLIDLDHSLEANGLGSDKIIGHVKATSFKIPKDLDEKELSSLSEPLPVYGLGVLFLRASGIPEIINAHNSNKRKWQVSMECGHKWKDAFFLYRNEFIPLTDSEIAMRNCIEADAVRDYKGHQLSVCLGGMDGSVDFWGTALTDHPADKKSDILNFIGGQSKELSSKKIFHIPLHKYLNTELEVANSSVDKKITELSSIGILGETEPAGEDNHKHYLLSNLLVYHAGDSNGDSHQHTLDSFNISRGSNPTLTGVTSPRYCSMPMMDDNGASTGRTKEVSHMHMVNIPLKGKFKNGGVNSVNNEEDDSDVSNTELSKTHLSKEDEMTLKEALKKLDDGLEKLTKATTDAERANVQTEIASTRKEIAKIESEKATDDEKKEYVNQLVKDGAIIPKETVQKMIDDKLKEKDDEYKANVKLQEARQKRLTRCTEAKIDLDTQFEGISDTDGQPMTFRKKLETIPVDENGDKLFEMDFLAWSKLFAEEERVVEQQTQQTQQREAANTGANKNKKPNVLALASAGKKEEESGEEANSGKNKNVPRHLLGARGLKSFSNS